MWEEVSGPGNAISPCFRDKVKVTTIVVFGWAKEPSIKAVGRPRSASIRIFINDCLGAKGCHWVAIPVVRALKGFVSGVIWIDSRSPEQVDGILNLRGKFVPKLDREVGVGRAKRPVWRYYALAVVGTSRYPQWPKRSISTKTQVEVQGSNPGCCARGY